MSLAAMLATHDDAALTALSSKGLLRRATRDLEAGAAEIKARSETAATVETDGHVIEIDGSGAKAARCTCPASGVCRHILLAVLVLRQGTSSGDATVSSELRPAAEEIAALPGTALTKFAGADWGPAQKLASHGARIEENGSSCSVHPEGAAVQVTFLAGQGLDAVYKGPSTRRRVYIAAAAIAVRAQAGVAVSAAESLADETKVDPAFCDGVARTLETAVASTFTGSAEVAADALFDQAISAKAGAAPRLAAQVRALSNAATLAARRDVAFQPSEFIEAAARAHALARALVQTPGDPALTGAVARTYRAVEPMELWLLGASRWRTPSGARGATLHLFDPNAQQWMSQVTARGAGVDLGFDPSIAYYGALWGAGSARDLMGTQLTLPAPKVSEDGQISATLAEPAKRLSDKLTVGVLSEIGTDDWQDFQTDIGHRIGIGLRRSATPRTALILPRRLSDLSFDDLAQTYRLEALDRSGAKLALEISAADESLAPNLFAVRADVVALLVEALSGPRGWSIRPVTALCQGAKGIRVVNLGFDQIGTGAPKTALTKLADKVIVKLRKPEAEADRLLQLCDAVADTLVDLHTAPLDADSLIARVRTLGLTVLADALVRATSARDARSSLTAAYIVSELRVALSARG